LRKLASEIEAQGRPSLSEAAAASAPGWLRGALRRTLGRREAEAYLSAGPVPPPIGLSLRSGEDRATWIAELEKVLPSGTFEEGKASPRAILVRGAGDVRRLPGAGTAWIIQEEGAQIVALALGAMPGERVLDACSGRGNKTWLLADAVGKTGAVDAADLYPSKLERLRSSSFGDAVHDTFAIDWSVDNQSSEAPPRDYDRVLVDAPCSGIGTLRRRPEIALHRTIDDIKRLSDLQTVIVRNAAKHVKTGGRLVFAVCSVLREEAENVVEQLVQQPAGSEMTLLPAPFDCSVLRPLIPEGATSMRLLPHVQGTDGYFIASFEVQR
jgi:16S rRNA (cytosine967-C5)-methyltransferase